MHTIFLHKKTEIKNILFKGRIRYTAFKLNNTSFKSIFKSLHPKNIFGLPLNLKCYIETIIPSQSINVNTLVSFCLIIYLSSNPPASEASRGVYWNQAQKKFARPYTEYTLVSVSLSLCNSEANNECSVFRNWRRNNKFSN